MGTGTLYGSLKRMLADGLIEEAGEKPDPTRADERRRSSQSQARRVTDYHLEQAAGCIRMSGYALADDFADNNVLKPPAEAKAIEVFERMVAQRRHTLSCLL
jgi:hypothetical protein